MTIGTAKPSPEELKTVKHYFADEFPVTENVSAAGFESLSLRYLDEIFKSSPAAVVCGGTGLYIKALTEGLDKMPAVNQEVEREINAAYHKFGLSWLKKEISQEDPLFFAQAEQQNPARLLRALIFIRSTGKSLLDFKTGTKKQRPFQIIKVALELPRKELYERINQRVDIMMREGLLEEAKRLFPFRHLKNLQTVGYSELFDFMEGRYSLEEAVEKIKQHTRNYAKRQITWFKKDPEFIWLNPKDPEILEKILNANK